MFSLLNTNTLHEIASAIKRVDQSSLIWMSGALTLLCTAYEMSPGRKLANSAMFTSLQEETQHFAQQEHVQLQKACNAQQTTISSKTNKSSAKATHTSESISEQLHHHHLHNSHQCQLTPAPLSLLASSPIAPQALEFHLVKASPLPSLPLMEIQTSQHESTEKWKEQLSSEQQTQSRKSMQKEKSTWNKYSEAWHQFYLLLRIAIPSWKSREAQVIACQHILLLLRVIVSVFVSRMYAKLSKTILSGTKREIVTSLACFAGLCIPASLLDVSLNYLNELLQLHFRENLTKYFSKRYLTEKVFYRLATLSSSSTSTESNTSKEKKEKMKILMLMKKTSGSRLDQRITDDVQRWSVVTAFASTSLTRPLVEGVTFSILMFHKTGWYGPLLTWCYYVLFAALSIAWSPDREQLIEQRMERKAALRAAQQRLIMFSEEVALLRGFDYERNYLYRLVDDIADQAHYAAFVLARYNLMETLYTKYGSVILSYAIGAIGLIHARKNILILPSSEIEVNNDVNKKGRSTLNVSSDGKDSEQMLAHYSELTFIFRTLAKAIGRVLYNIKLCSIINGYTRRLSDLREVMECVEHQVHSQEHHVEKEKYIHNTKQDLQDQQEQLLITNNNSTSQHVNNNNNTFAKTGVILRDEYIEFVDVPLITPAGECLCANLSFFVKPGMNLLIMGPNGCGKTSTFRILGELWPLHHGLVRKPERSQLYYIPQRPYMYDGTLFEQIIYPTPIKMAQVSESELYKYMHMAGLAYLFDKPDFNWHTHLNWSDDTLSMGEKQKLAMARLFYHRPRFAILDECSSCLDTNVERNLYVQCAALGITVITIAHRRSAWKYHNWVLHMNGSGGYVFGPLQIRKEDSNPMETDISNSVTTTATKKTATKANGTSTNHEVRSESKKVKGEETNQNEDMRKESTSESSKKEQTVAEALSKSKMISDVVVQKTIMYIPRVVKSSDKTIIGEEYIVKVFAHHHHHHDHPYICKEHNKNYDNINGDNNNDDKSSESENDDDIEVSANTDKKEHVTTNNNNVTQEKHQK